MQLRSSAELSGARVLPEATGASCLRARRDSRKSAVDEMEPCAGENVGARLLHPAALLLLLAGILRLVSSDVGPTAEPSPLLLLLVLRPDRKDSRASVDGLPPPSDGLSVGATAEAAVASAASTVSIFGKGADEAAGGRGPKLK